MSWTIIDVEISNLNITHLISENCCNKHGWVHVLVINGKHHHFDKPFSPRTPSNTPVFVGYIPSLLLEVGSYYPLHCWLHHVFRLISPSLLVLDMPKIVGLGKTSTSAVLSQRFILPTFPHLKWNIYQPVTSTKVPVGAGMTAAGELKSLDLESPMVVIVLINPTMGWWRVDVDVLLAVPPFPSDSPSVFLFLCFPSSFIPHVHFLRLRLPSFGVCFLLFIIVFPYYSSFLFFFSFFFFSFSFSFSFFFLLLFFFFLIPSSSSFFFLALPCSYFFFLVLPCSLFCQTHLTWHLLQVCSTAPQVVLAFIKRNWEATFRVTDKM